MFYLSLSIIDYVMSNNKTEPNEPAFACASDTGHQEGLTKRERR